MKVVGYLRVSTEEQARDGVSMETQEEKIRGYCRLYDLDLVEVVKDPGASAKTLNRTGLRRVLAMLEAGEVEGVVIPALDRITRNVQDWTMLIDRYFGEKCAWKLMSVGERIDTRTAAGRMVLNILVVVAQWQREYVVERTSEVLAGLRERGKQTGTVPYGYDPHPDDVGLDHSKRDGVRLLRNEPEQLVIARIVEWRGDGMSLSQIAGKLNDLEIPTKTRKGPWRHTTVASILAVADRPPNLKVPDGREEDGGSEPPLDQRATA